VSRSIWGKRFLQPDTSAPVQFGWADNYVSLVGLQYSGITSVCLRKSLDNNPNFVSELTLILKGSSVGDRLFRLLAYAHGYSSAWYSDTLTTHNLMKPLHLGFYDSYESSLLDHTRFPDVSLRGTFWEQNDSSVEELALVQIPAPSPERLDCGCQTKVLIDRVSGPLAEAPSLLMK
jgi:hypothetical protein